MIGPLQHGANLGEGGFRPHHRDEGGLLVEVLAEPDEKDVGELVIVDGVTKITEFINDGFEPLAVDPDRRSTLNGVAELCVETFYAGVDIILEELAKSCP
jgi:hypothetical protein